MKALKRKDSTDEKPVWGEIAELGEIRTWARDSYEPTPFGHDMNMDLLAVVYAAPIENIEQYELVDVKLSVCRANADQIEVGDCVVVIDEKYKQAYLRDYTVIGISPDGFFLIASDPSYKIADYYMGPSQIRKMNAPIV